MLPTDTQRMPELNKIYVGDCLDVMKTWPDKSVNVIITDPVWPNAKVVLHGSDDPYEALRRSAEEWPRLCSTAIVQLGCDSDPRILSAIPASLPFQRIAWLRYARPHYKGRLLYSGDVAYVFGEPRTPIGKHLMPGEHTLVESRREENIHPCPRQLSHLSFLVASFTHVGDTILDPFCGSGTTLLACERLDRKWVGIEIDPNYAQEAESRISKERTQMKLAM